MTIAGFDPSGGAGVLADIKTIAALGCFGVAAITSITSQNTRGVYTAYHQSEDVLRGQILPLLDDFEIAAVKIGMLPTTEQIKVVVELLERVPLKNIVIDPVFQSTSGHALINIEARQFLIESLLPYADVVTPNLSETEVLLGIQCNSVEEMKAAARVLSFRFSQKKQVAILVKGGHLNSGATDVLFDGENEIEFSSSKLMSRHTHGTGCTLASAIASLLAQGLQLSDAIQEAKEFVRGAIQHAPGLGKGKGPMNHFFNYVPKSSII
ncbi:MAG: bifunctional hydroxymethylpyrimidine kinase/phosphomethylpyrimidine kinase [Blastocatellia bacterium]|nr:bifunctional hydroxymethylpyrimidine kinase/phosphomethylpyrimidine kinase [Blastocatellia bacterium]